MDPKANATFICAKCSRVYYQANGFSLPKFEIRLLSQVTQNPTSMFCFQILIQRYAQKLAEGGH